jgi:PAS domain S-box-containing protein
MGRSIGRLDCMKKRQSIEALAHKFFGSNWAEDERIHAFVRASWNGPETDSAPPAMSATGSLGELAPAALLRLVLDAIPDGVFWKDRQSRFIGTNRTFARDAGLGCPSEAIGLDDYSIAERRLADEYRSIDQAVIENDEAVTNLREPQIRDGELAWIETNKIPLHDADGEVIGLLGTYSDITQQVQQEEILATSNSELEETSRFKDQFLAAVSHELRTPLNPILALAEAMRSGVYGEMDERQQEALGHVAKNASKLHHLIEDILAISALEFGNGQVELDLYPVRIDELLEKAVAGIADLAEVKGIEIERRCGGQIEGHFHLDRRRVEKVLGILLDNAVKFTPPGGRIVLEASNGDTPDTLRLAVADNGIGIAPEDQDGLFQNFGQVDRELTRSYNGIGLGLSLAKHMAEQHGGSIEVQSAPGEGSRFTLSLPRKEHSQINHQTYHQ